MKSIPLSQGLSASVDDEDYDELIKFKWYALRSKKAFYAVRNIKKGDKTTLILMHRVIMQAADNSIQVDHVNHDGLENIKINLRNCINQQNSRNKPKQNLATPLSKYKGVSPSIYNTFYAQITFEDRKIHLGSFKKETEAALAYNKAALELFGSFAYVNNV